MATRVLLPWDHRPQLSPEIIGYLAGLIDGEGCISLDKAAGSGERRYSSPGAGLIPRVRIYNSVRSMIDFIDYHWPGGSVSTANYKQKSHHLTQYYWQLMGKRGAVFLSAIEPFLVAKRIEAQAYLMFVETMEPSWKMSGGVAGGLRLTPEAITMRRLALHALRQAKSRNNTREVPAWDPWTDKDFWSKKAG